MGRFNLASSNREKDIPLSRKTNRKGGGGRKYIEIGGKIFSRKETRKRTVKKREDCCDRGVCSFPGSIGLKVLPLRDGEEISKKKIWSNTAGRGNNKSQDE